jgi:hypothetical protein
LEEQHNLDLLLLAVVALEVISLSLAQVVQEFLVVLVAVQVLVAPLPLVVMEVKVF